MWWTGWVASWSGSPRDTGALAGRLWSWAKGSHSRSPALWAPQWAAGSPLPTAWTTAYCSAVPGHRGSWSWPCALQAQCDNEGELWPGPKLLGHLWGKNWDIFFKNSNLWQTNTFIKHNKIKLWEKWIKKWTYKMQAQTFIIRFIPHKITL